MNEVQPVQKPLDLEPPDPIITIDSLDQFVTILAAWHSDKCAVVKHMLELPDGAEFTIGEGDQEAPLILTGDAMAGFKFGIEMALMQLGTLPFVAEMEEPEPVPE